MQNVQADHLWILLGCTAALFPGGDRAFLEATSHELPGIDVEFVVSLLERYESSLGARAPEAAVASREQLCQYVTTRACSLPHVAAAAAPRCLR